MNFHQIFHFLLIFFISFHHSTPTSIFPLSIPYLLSVSNYIVNNYHEYTCVLKYDGKQLQWEGHMEYYQEEGRKMNSEKLVIMEQTMAGFNKCGGWLNFYGGVWVLYVIYCQVIFIISFYSKKIIISICIFSTHLKTHHSLPHLIIFSSLVFLLFIFLINLSIFYFSLTTFNTFNPFLIFFPFSFYL